MKNVLSALEKDGAKGAVKICQKEQGPVAAVLHAGLLRLGRGLEHVAAHLFGKPGV